MAIEITLPDGSVIEAEDGDDWVATLAGMKNMLRKKYASPTPAPVKNFVDRYMRPSQYPTLPNSDGSVSTHRMTSAEVDGKYIAYPTIVQIPTGELQELGDDEAFEYAMKHREYMEFPTDNQAREFAEGGYKRMAAPGERSIKDVYGSQK
jgi:hypothetical protein